MTRKLLTILIVGVALTLPGCGGTGEVSGVVKLKGQPLPTGTITFFDEAGKTWSGTINEGAYTVKGIPTGTAKVVVITPQNIQMPGVAPVKTIPINPKYNDANSSGLTYDVRNGPQTKDWDLTD
jgi:hypothetical protein